MDEPPVQEQVHIIFKLLMYCNTYFSLLIIPNPILDEHNWIN